MKKNTVIQVAVLAALGLAVILSLVVPQVIEDRPSPSPLELSVIVQEQDSSLWFNSRQGMEQAAVDLNVDLRFFPLSSTNDSAEQAQLIRRETDNGTDAFIISPADPLALEPKLADLTDQRPVISMYSPMAGAVDLVSTDNVAVGQSLAEALVKDWDGGAVLLLDTSPRCTAVTQRLDAAQKTLLAAGVPVEVRTLSADELPTALPRLTSQTAARFVMAFEHSATTKAAEAKEARALTCNLYGVGCTSRITAFLERKTLTAIAAWSDYAAGYQAVSQAVARYNTGSAAVPLTPVSFLIVHGEDIYDTEIQKLLFPVTS